MAVSRRGDHAVEHRALDGQRGREGAAQPRAAQGEQQRPLGPRQLDCRPPVGRRRGIVGQQPRPLPPLTSAGPRRHGASARAASYPSGARAGARGGGCAGASESSSEASSGRGQRCPQGRPCAGPPFHPPPRWSSRSATASSASQPRVGSPYAITRCGVHSRARSGCKTCSPGPSLHLVGVRLRLRLRLRGGVGGRA